MPFFPGHLPPSWKIVIILPILKPNTDPLLPVSYRPIALSSVLGKLFQKILNKRLYWFLESNNFLSPVQYGFRKSRNSSQALLDLQSEINEATLHNSCLYSIFFDLQEAFPRVWRHYIIHKLFKLGLRGNLPRILQTFLNDRKLSVRIQNTISSPVTVHNGVPQGEVFSVLLFLVAIDDITKCVKFPLTQRLFADDFNISVRSSDPFRARRILQETLNSISTWCSLNGSRFSPLKTFMVIFKARKPIPTIQPLFLQNFEIPVRDSAKLLGLIFDQKLTWLPHIKILKAKCSRALSVIKYLSHPSKGCNRKLLLQLYKSLIRSRLDYGAPIYNLASKSVLKLLDPIQTHSLRLALGAFYTSPRLSLCAEAAEPPLTYRRLILTSNLMSSISQFPQLPVYHSTLHTEVNYLQAPKNKQIRLKFEQALNKSFSPNPLQPIHSLSPPWTFLPPSIRLDLTQIASPNKSIYLRHINQLLNEYADHSICLTDGSKNKNGTAYAYSINGVIVAHRIRNIASIYSAELMAIYACLSDLSQLPPNNRYTLLTDSLSSLHSLTDPFATNPLIQRILIVLSTLNSNNINVTFIWIPGHINFPDHDAVDQAAKHATSLSTISDQSFLPAADYKNYYRSLVLKQWHTFWRNQQPNKLNNIKKEPVPWSTSVRENRREEVILTRLRIGHTRITHSYLIDPYIFTPPPSCPYCKKVNLTVEHLFSCPLLQPLRSAFHAPSSVTQALKNDSNSVSSTILYLRHTLFFPLI